MNFCFNYLLLVEHVDLTRVALLGHYFTFNVRI